MSSRKSGSEVEGKDGGGGGTFTFKDMQQRFGADGDARGISVRPEVTKRTSRGDARRGFGSVDNDGQLSAGLWLQFSLDKQRGSAAATRTKGRYGQVGHRLTGACRQTVTTATTATTGQGRPSYGSVVVAKAVTVAAFGHHRKTDPGERNGGIEFFARYTRHKSAVPSVNPVAVHSAIRRAPNESLAVPPQSPHRQSSMRISVPNTVGWSIGVRKIVTYAVVGGSATRRNSIDPDVHYRLPPTCSVNVPFCPQMVPPLMLAVVKTHQWIC